jgi:hypothetical protein
MYMYYAGGDAQLHLPTYIHIYTYIYRYIHIDIYMHKVLVHDVLKWQGATRCFAHLLRLLPLEKGVPDPEGLPADIVAGSALIYASYFCGRP